MKRGIRDDSQPGPDSPIRIPHRPVRVLVVDDSAIVRRVLTDTLRDSPGIEVIGTAPDPYVARDKIVSLAPDVVTLDIEMPRMDGLTFLRRLMRYQPTPVIVISSIAAGGSDKAVEALRIGAIEVIPKPGGPYSVGELKEDLPRKILAAANARLPKRNHLHQVATVDGRPPVGGVSAQPPSRWRLLAFGASTGGTQALEAVLRQFPARCPPTVVVQHIPPGFSTSFSQRLNAVCAPEVREANDGDSLDSGLVLIAPGSKHLTVTNCRGGLVARLDNGPKVCYQRPSVDVLFESVAATNTKLVAAVLLTGMGSDGAQGLLALRKAGAHTIAESEETCVVFGMPREAISLGAATSVVPLHQIAPALGFSGRSSH